MGAPNYITDNKGNIVYPRTLAKCVKKGGTTLDDYLDKVEDNLLIKPTAQGTDIQLKDSSDMNIQELHLYGRTEQASTTGSNLFDVNDTKDKSIFTVDDEGYVTATINPNNTDGNEYYNFYTRKSDLLKTDTEYLIVTEILEIPTEKCQLNTISLESIFKGQFANAVASETKGIKFNKAKTRNDMSGCVTMMRGFMFTKPGFTGGKIKFRMSVLEDTSITADTFKYEPYTGGQPSPNPDYPQEIESVENPTVSVTGKNKAKEYKVNKTDKPYTTILSIDADLEANKEYSLSFIAAKGLWFYFNENLFAYDMKQATGDYQTIKLKTVATLSKDNPNQFNKSLQKWIILKTDAKNTVVADFDKVQLEEGNVGTAYEEYKEIQSAQPTCELNGIDDVRDELIVRADGTGKMIQRWKKKDVPNNVTWQIQEQNGGFNLGYTTELYKDAKKTEGFLSIWKSNFGKSSEKWKNEFSFGKSSVFWIVPYTNNVNDESPLTSDKINEWLSEHPMTVLYPLEEPIVNELSAEEVQKILNLHTNKTNTTIWNDQNAEMQVTYVADTKSYIDKKFKELSDAIVASASEAE